MWIQELNHKRKIATPEWRGHWRRVEACTPTTDRECARLTLNGTRCFSALSLLMLSLALPVTTPLFAAAPCAHTQPATQITTTNATLNGMAVPNGEAGVAWFEWGARGSYDRTTSPVDVGDGTAVVRVNAEISGLTNGRSYQCRLVVSNAADVVYGPVQLFTTGRKITAWGRNDYDQTYVPWDLTNAVAVAGGFWHSLALKNDGTVAAWRLNYEGQSDVPSDLTNAVAVAADGFQSLALKADGMVVVWGIQTNVPSGLSNAVAIAAGGYYHHVALKADGMVVVWGDQTGAPSGLSNVVAIAAGAYHSLALKADGTVEAWGGNTEGQTNVPPGLSNVVAVAGGFWHSLALKTDGTVVAWGNNTDGQTNVPSGLSNVVTVAAGGFHNLALKNDGTVVAWGRNTDGQATIPSGVSNVVAVAGGGYHSLALVGDRPPQATSQTVSGPANLDLVIVLGGSDPDGDGLSFRINSLPAQGALYQYTNGVRGPAMVSPGSWVSDAGGRVVFAPATNSFGKPYADFSFVANDGELDSTPATVTVLVIGSQAFTQPATLITATDAALNGMVVPNGLASVAWFEWGTRGGYSQVTAPVNVGNGTTVVRVNAGISGLTRGGVYQCRLVVSNAAGVVYGAAQLFTTGRKITAWGRSADGQIITVIPGLSNVVAVAGGYWQSLALKSGGTVAVVWGDKPGNQTNLPPGLSNVVAITAGGSHSLALQSDGTVVAWGNNSAGQTNVPAGLSNVIVVAAGGFHNLALKADGTVVAWGYNTYGQTNVPAGLSNVVAVASGTLHSLALQAGGTVAAWGYNNYGQGTAPAGLSNVVAVATGGYHNLALRADGTVTAWGDNWDSQTNVPAGLSDVVVVAAGGSHSLALKSDGTVVAWGSNAYGQTNVTAGLSNVVAVAGGGYHSLAIGPNLPPVAQTLTNSGYPNHDLVIQVRGSDPNGDLLSYRVATVPAAGALYEFNAGARGAAITAPDTSVSDVSNRVIFAPAANMLGSPHASFSYLANDGEADSASATVAINVVLPPAPQFSVAGPSWGTNGEFQLNFTGHSNATYRVWASTNLVDWEVLGTGAVVSNGWFQFLDAEAGGWPQRFYRAGAP